MPISDLFYILGTVAFASFIILVFTGVIILLVIYHKLTTLKRNIQTQIPEKAINYLQGHNSQVVRGLGVAILGMVINAIKNKISRKS